MKHLLVVEDNPNALSGLVELLGDEGYDVDGVLQGSDALEVAAQKNVDMVLCDYHLPDTNGLQVCQRLKAINPATIFFLTTASDSTRLFDEADQCGISKIFLKPLDLDDLFDSLLRASTNPVAN